jgi:hypothetical protein
MYSPPCIPPLYFVKRGNFLAYFALHPLFAKPTLYTHLFELGFSSVCELLGKRVFIRLLSVTGDSSLRSE